MFGIDLLGRQAGSQAPGTSEGRGFHCQDTGLGWLDWEQQQQLGLVSKQSWSALLYI